MHYFPTFPYYKATVRDKLFEAANYPSQMQFLSSLQFPGKDLSSLKAVNRKVKKLVPLSSLLM